MKELVKIVEKGLKANSYSIDFSNIAELAFGLSGHLEFTKNKQDYFAILFWEGSTQKIKIFAPNEIHPSVSAEFSLLQNILQSSNYQISSFGTTEEEAVRLVISQDAKQFELSLFLVQEEEDSNLVF